MYYGGEQNIPGAPGNVGSLVAGNPSFDINRGAAGDSRMSPGGGSNLPGAIGNMGGMQMAGMNMPMGFNNKFVS